ncbi:TGF-beta receptor type-1 [Toxocara canis]|uniref:receptor protein serine/threonine kinase n=1 Tax=Toxocara canis TaxID=6265 RepID=A0A0B2V048_TOXCA|nr:TGF-beta receptor type-1 [Toxocara canis]
MRRFEANLKYPVNLETDIMCNCTHAGCDVEVTRFLGKNFTHICRATGGACYKRIALDGTTIHACLGLDAVPDLFCSTKQPMPDGSVMACCSNQSFCNGALNLKLPVQPESDSTPWRVVAIVAVVLIAVALVSGILLTLAVVNKPLKQCIFYWLFRRPNASSTQGVGTEEMLLGSPSDDLAHLSDLLGNLDDSDTTGSGSGYKKRVGTEEMLLGSPSDDLAHLSDLLGNLDDSDTTGSGSGLPLLVQRTIARQIELHTEIGKGRFGEVWLGSWKGDPVAVKIFSSRDERSWNREVEVFQTNMLRHSNILRFIASDNKDTGTSMQLWLVTEYHAHGSLFDYLSENTISGPVMLQMLRSIANGLAFLHAEVPGMHSKPAIAHRDLKTKNILVKSNLTCVIADLGLAVRYINGELNLPDNNKCGTIRYLSPEVLSDSYPIHQFDAYKMSDMYAIGLIIWELATRCDANGDMQAYEPPYAEWVTRDPSIEEMRECVCVHKHRPTVRGSWKSDKVMSDIERMMMECWAESPPNRLTAMNVRIAVDRLANSLDWKLQTSS